MSDITYAHPRCFYCQGWAREAETEANRHPNAKAAQVGDQVGDDYHWARYYKDTTQAFTRGWVPDESETDMTETAHQHCAICDWLGREAERTAKDLGRTAWISEAGFRANPREHWARYEQEEA